MTKKLLKTLAVAAVTGTMVFATTGCKDGNNVADQPQYKIYQLAAEAGFTGTYEEWLATIRGADGAAGLDGATWLIGTVAPTAAQGQNGDFYLNTASWDLSLKSDGAWSVIGNIKGPAGQNGTDGISGKDGAAWLNGAVAPTATQGKDGDFYLNTATWDLYHKVTGTWSKLGNIKGLTGETGQPGTPGQNGIPGRDGATWLAGVAAPTDSQGVSGDFYLNTVTCDLYQKGDNSWQIVANIKGTAGQDGESGTPGKDGSTWLTGSTAPTAELGTEGDIYLHIPTWDIYTKANGVWTKIGNIKGAQGEAGQDGHEGKPGEAGQAGLPGADGSTWLAAAVDPEETQGKDGDFYLNTVTYDLFRKADSSWQLIGNIKGEPGETVAPATVVVTFDARGGTLIGDASVSVTAGSTIELPEATRRGFRFIGWTTGFGSGDGLWFTNLPVTGNMTLYAVWENPVLEFNKRELTEEMARNGEWVFDVATDEQVVTYLELFSRIEKAESRQELENIRDDYYNLWNELNGGSQSELDKVREEYLNTMRSEWDNLKSEGYNTALYQEEFDSMQKRLYEATDVDMLNVCMEDFKQLTEKVRATGVDIEVYRAEVISFINNAWEQVKITLPDIDFTVYEAEVSSILMEINNAGSIDEIKAAKDKFDQLGQRITEENYKVIYRMHFESMWMQVADKATTEQQTAYEEIMGRLDAMTGFDQDQLNDLDMKLSDLCSQINGGGSQSDLDKVREEYLNTMRSEWDNLQSDGYNTALYQEEFDSMQKRLYEATDVDMLKACMEDFKQLTEKVRTSSVDLEGYRQNTLNQIEESWSFMQIMYPEIDFDKYLNLKNEIIDRVKTADNIKAIDAASSDFGDLFERPESPIIRENFKIIFKTTMEQQWNTIAGKATDDQKARYQELLVRLDQMESFDETAINQLNKDFYILSTEVTA